ncbi:hypothetical protein Mmc1_2247 [Magnetococcus marinus MC-1]|uniref:Uncharacterized protein n=1 Tax=Magnetococcus marinus (strain ATCC BAA-1437 / JCM 17883 / MC-1) TaxID=156889 RepID=A0L9V5_MAGMM|nr:hypothetical protein [Magnetococcus marinus]ABK44748.1 hypothetical protein Mmc1_2247 [Magnetococcus marinus MC-1]
MLEDAATLLSHPKASLWFALALVVWALFMWISLRLRQIKPVQQALDDALLSVEFALESQGSDRLETYSEMLAQNPVLGSAWSAYRNTFVATGDDTPLRSVDRVEHFFSAERILPFHVDLKWIRTVPMLVAGLALVASLFGMMTALHGQLNGVENLDVQTVRLALAGLLGAATSKLMAVGIGLLAAILFAVEMRQSVDALEGRLQAFTERLGKLVEYVPAETLLLAQWQRQSGGGAVRQDVDVLALDRLSNRLIEALHEGLEQSALRAETRQEQLANLMRDALFSGMKKMRLDEGERLHSFQLNQDRLIERLEEGLSATLRHALLPLAEERGRGVPVATGGAEAALGRDMQQERLLERIALSLEKGMQSFSEELDQQGRQHGHLLERLREGVDQNADAMGKRIEKGLESQSERLEEQLKRVVTGLDEHSRQLREGVDQNTDAMGKRVEKALESQSERLEDQLKRVVNGLDDNGRQRAQQMDHLGRRLDEGAALRDEKMAQRFTVMGAKLEQQGKQHSERLNAGLTQLAEEINAQTAQLQTGLNALGERLEKGSQERAEQLLQFMRRGEWWRGEFLQQLKELLGDVGRRVIDGVRQELQGLKQAADHSATALEQLREALARQDLTLLRSDLARAVQDALRQMDNNTDRLLSGMQNMSGDLLRGQQGLGEKLSAQGQLFSVENRETQRMVKDLNDSVGLLPERLLSQMEPVLERVNQSLLKWQKRREQGSEAVGDSAWQSRAEQQVAELIERQRRDLVVEFEGIKARLETLAPVESGRFQTLSEQLERVMTLLAGQSGQVAGLSLEPVLAWIKDESSRLADANTVKIESAMHDFSALLQGQRQDLQSLQQQVNKSAHQLDQVLEVDTLTAQQAESLFAQARSQWEGVLLESKQLLHQALAVLQHERGSTAEGLLPSLQGVVQRLEKAQQSLHEGVAQLVVERLNGVVRQEQAKQSEWVTGQLEQLQQGLLGAIQQQRMEARAQHDTLMEAVEQVKRQKVDLEPVLDAVREQGDRVAKRHTSLTSIVELVRDEMQGLTTRMAGLNLSDEQIERVVENNFQALHAKLPAALDVNRMREMLSDALHSAMQKAPKGDVSQVVAQPMTPQFLENSVQQALEQVGQRIAERFEQDSAAIRRALDRLQQSSEALDARSSRLHGELIEALAHGQGEEQAQLEKSLRDSLERGFRQLREQVEAESGRLRQTADALVKRLEGWQQPPVVDLSPILEVIRAEGGRVDQLSSSTISNLLQGLRGELQVQLRETADKLAFVSGQVAQLNTGFEKQLEGLTPALLAKISGAALGGTAAGDAGALRALQEQMQQLSVTLTDAMSQRVDAGAAQIERLSQRMDGLLVRVDQRVQGMSEHDIRTLLETHVAEANLAEMDQQQLQIILEGMANAVQERLTGEADRLQRLSKNLEGTLETLRIKAEKLDETFLDSALDLLREEGERLAEGGVEAVHHAMGRLGEQLRLEVSRDASQMRQTAEQIEALMGRIETASHSLDGEAFLRRLNDALQESGRLQLDAVKASAQQLRDELQGLFSQAMEKVTMGGQGLSEAQLQEQLIEPVVARLKAYDEALASSREAAMGALLETLAEKLSSTVQQGLEPIQTAVAGLRELVGQGGQRAQEEILDKLLALADQVAQLQENSEMTMEELEALDQPFMQLAQFLHENAENMSQTHNAVVMLTEEFPLVLADMLAQLDEEPEEEPL